MLVRADVGGVGHVGFLVRVGGQRLQQLLENAALIPAREAGVNGLPRTKSLRQIPPRNSRRRDVRHRVNEPTIREF